MELGLLLAQVARFVRDGLLEHGVGVLRLARLIFVVHGSLLVGVAGETWVKERKSNLANIWLEVNPC